MAEWINITVPNYLTPEITETIYNNFQYIVQETGISASLVEPQFYYGMDLEQILPQFNIIEEDIEAIQNQLPNEFEKSFEIYTWTVDTVYKYPKVKRWIDWLNYIKSVLEG